jgi:glycerophosphoryl diester phosphodiesterase
MTRMDMNNPLSVSNLARPVWHDFLRARRALYIYEFTFKLVEAWLLIPAAAVVLAMILFRAGHVAVSNQDIVDFLLTPLGLLYGAFLATVSAALILFEQAGIMVLANRRGASESRTLKQALRAAVGKSLRIVQLGAVQAGLLALAVSPFVLLAVLTYGIFLTEHDIYFYLNDRPPVFWLAASIGGLLLLAAIAIGAMLWIRWALALPILLFENQCARSALRASRERIRGVGRRVGFVLLGWLVGVLLLGIVLEASFRLFALAVLNSAGERPVALILLLLLGRAGLLATLSFFLIVGLGLLTLRLYLVRREQLDIPLDNELSVVENTGKSVAPWNRRLTWLSLPLFLLAPLAIWVSLSRYQAARPAVQVTAHRGNARAAPENTLSAMRKAIENGADYAEMDVHMTADGVVVLLHDRDLKRVAGVSRRLDELTYDEVRKLDVGSWFDPAFAAERIPTLAEVIDLCRGKIRLNVELKVFGPEPRLGPKVADIIREHEYEAHCLITSLNYDVLRDVKRHDPKLRTGLTIAQALGNISRLEVDALSVRADFLTDDMLRAAHRLGREVHVWTINDAGQMIRMMKRGVDNVITSDPDMAIRVRSEWSNMPATERLVLASRILLGLDP